MPASQQLPPEQVTKLRVVYRTKHEFLKEHNVVRDDEPVSRSDIRQLCSQLCYSERQALESRLGTKLRRLEALMDGDTKQFDGPAVRHGDLASGVRIPNFYE
jgi:hypothetical protein